MNKTIVIIALVALVLGGVVGYVLAPEPVTVVAPPIGALDSTTIGNPWIFTNTITNTGTFKIGSNGSTITELKASTCDLIGADVSQVASSTKAYDCAVTGIASGDFVLGQLAKATAFGTNIGWTIHATLASTTAGYVTVILGNWSGVDAVSSVTGVGSSTQILYIDN